MSTAVWLSEGLVREQSGGVSFPVSFPMSFGRSLAEAVTVHPDLEHVEVPTDALILAYSISEWIDGAPSAELLANRHLVLVGPESQGAQINPMPDVFRRVNGDSIDQVIDAIVEFAHSGGGSKSVTIGVPAARTQRGSATIETFLDDAPILLRIIHDQETHVDAMGLIERITRRLNTAIDTCVSQGLPPELVDVLERLILPDVARLRDLLPEIAQDEEEREENHALARSARDRTLGALTALRFWTRTTANVADDVNDAADAATELVDKF